MSPGDGPAAAASALCRSMNLAPILTGPSAALLRRLVSSKRVVTDYHPEVVKGALQVKTAVSHLRFGHA